MKFRKKLILSGAMCALCGNMFAQGLTAEDYCDPAQNRPKRIAEMRPMADGLSYSATDGRGKTIDVYSYKTGKKTSTLFNVDEVKGDVKISQFAGYKISDNEKTILLWDDVKPIYRRSYTAKYYVYDVMRGTMKKVSEKGGQQAALLSHDGRKVAYVRENNIFISNLEYGTDLQITTDGVVNEVINGIPDWAYEEEFGMSNTMRWSADDNTLAFIRFDESKVPVYSFDDYRSYCVEDPEGDLYPAATRYKYPLPGFPNSVVSVKAYDLNNRTTKTMDLPIGETDYVPSLEFDGEGTQLMAMIVNRDQNELKLFRVNPGSTVARQVYTERSEAWLEPDYYQGVTYNKLTFVIPSKKSGWVHLYEYDYNGNLKRQITNGDFNVTKYYGRNAVGDDFFQCTKLGAVNRNVARVSAKGVMTLLHNEAGTESAAFSRSFDFYVRSYSNVTTPPQYTLWSIKGTKVADLELNQAYAARYASAPKMELLKIKNAVGEEMDACVIKPTNLTGKAPLLMYQYNGPGSQQVTNSWRMEGIFYLASQGYVIGIVDGRGTGNREASWEYAVYKQLGRYETEDQIAGAKWFATQPYVDGNRLGCFGWSYGGYMTLMELTADNSPFKAGVSMAPVTDWRFYDSIYTERFMLTPQQNAAGYEQASALHRSDKLKGRLLIMSGTSDDNVHFYNTLKFTSKLNYEGKIFDMMALTGFEHSLPYCNARTMLFRKIVDFLDVRLK